MFQLSKTFRGHEDDVKSLFAIDDKLFSSSRDFTIRQWPDVITYRSSAFINSLSYYKHDNEEYLISGGSDNLISLTKPGIYNEEPIYCLVGHEANVCALDCKDDIILSGSWDKTARVWTKNGQKLILKGHEASVWGVKILNTEGNGEFITCGADGTVRYWQGNQQIRCIKAHDDVVRDIKILPDGEIVTCSNDGTIKIWKDWQCVRTLHGHQSFIYSIDILSTGEIISCGEDRSIRIWKNFECVQVITLPCISIWKVIALSNGDIAVGSSDKTVRIFTKDINRVAKKSELIMFKKELETSSVSESSIQGVDTNNLPGLESLKEKGSTEGEIKMIMQNMKIEMYQWSFSEWVKIGEVVKGNSSNQKKFYKGNYYDYVFDVDISDGQPPLKLALNISDNPYEVAEKFMAEYELPYSYLQQIVDFILQNAEGVIFDANRSNSHSRKTILPIKKYLSFDKFEEAKIVSAFKKLNSQQDASVQLSDGDFEMLINCQGYDDLAQKAIEIINNWSDDSKLLGFDILRGIIDKIKPFENLFPILNTGLDSSRPKVHMMTLRVLANCFSIKWGEQLFLDEEVIDVVFKDIDINASKMMALSVCTLILNYSILINKFNMADSMGSKLGAIAQTLKPVDDESGYRLLSALGTLSKAGVPLDKQSITTNFSESKSLRYENVKSEFL